MVRKISITIIAKREILYELYENVKEYIYEPEASNCVYNGQGSLRVILDGESPGYRYLMDMSREYQLHPRVAQWVDYTKREIDSSEWFQMRLPEPLELEGVTAAYYGTQYKGGCPHCGLGGKSVGNVLVDRKFIRKCRMGILFPDIYVSEEVRRIIETNGLTGVSFDSEVRDYKEREMPKNYVMSIHHVLPPMSTSTWLCPDEYPDRRFAECGHQVLYRRSDIQYEKEKLKNAMDFNLSAEHINNFRLQDIIVSAKVRKVFKAHKIYSFFFPVALL